MSDPSYAFLSADMVATLHTYFVHYQKNDVVTLELNSMGVWLVNPHDNTRQFLGKAFHDADVPTIPPARNRWM